MFVVVKKFFQVIQNAIVVAGVKYVTFQKCSTNDSSIFIYWIQHNEIIVSSKNVKIFRKDVVIGKSHIHATINELMHYCTHDTDFSNNINSCSIANKKCVSRHRYLSISVVIKFLWLWKMMIVI